MSALQYILECLFQQSKYIYIPFKANRSPWTTYLAVNHMSCRPGRRLERRGDENAYTGLLTVMSAIPSWAIPRNLRMTISYCAISCLSFPVQNRMLNNTFKFTHTHWTLQWTNLFNMYYKVAIYQFFCYKIKRSKRAIILCSIQACIIFSNVHDPIHSFIHSLTHTEWVMWPFSKASWLL